jgi:hypothetical protein
MLRPLIVVLISALLGPVVFASMAMAQMRGPGLSMPGARAPSGFGHGLGVSFSGRPHFHSFGPGVIFLGDPFYADYPVAPVTIPPQFVGVQPTAAADTPQETKSEPLMIELQGNRYVRFGGRPQSAERGVNAAPDYAETQASNSHSIPQHPAQAELPPTVLIFRDGHREQVPEYAIVGSTLYASADYWQSGHWTKNIQLSALNIPATVTANHDNGVNFTLPSAPNEVVTRP